MPQFACPLMDTTLSTPAVDQYDQATYRALAGDSRRALLTLLQRAGWPFDAGEAGAAVGLHPNTARVHLDLLCSVGLLRRRTEERSRRGRPRVLYEVAEAVGILVGDQRARDAEIGYRDLARLLAQQLSELPDMPNEALRAGRRWAGVLNGMPLPTELLSRSETIGVVTELLQRLGFRPEADEDHGRVLLHHCPFVEIAKESRVVVCGVHLGMLKATVERLDAPLDVAGLDPFVADQPVCVVRLAARPTPAEQRRRRERRDAT